MTPFSSATSLLLIAAANRPPLEPPIWAAVPFVLTVLAIAVLPLAVPRFWHSNHNKGLVALFLAAPVAVYLLMAGPATGGESIHLLVHELGNYLSFIILLGSLYTVTGGVVLGGTIGASPLKNTLLLAGGAVLANVIGTTGASMLLIRPVLRSNRGRRHATHVPVFFIFVVSNLGGLLTPLGDPPLFLGYLEGVPFFWTLRLWQPWLVAVGTVLLVFFVWDWWAFRGEPTGSSGGPSESLRLHGRANLVLLAGILIAVLIQPHLKRYLPWGGGEALMVALATLSWIWTPQILRESHGFTWGPMVEVAVLFLGIFVTMVPALALLKVRGPEFQLSEPWEFFWLTGSLSAVLDNAPTYMTFATLAAAPEGLAELAVSNPLLLEAVSSGAVFMGALTYIGNGPNFMVKAIADASGLQMPSFFGYLLYSGLVLLPVFGLVTVLFFPPGRLAG